MTDGTPGPDRSCPHPLADQAGLAELENALAASGRGWALEVVLLPMTVLRDRVMSLTGPMAGGRWR